MVRRAKVWCDLRRIDDGSYIPPGSRLRLQFVEKQRARDGGDYRVLEAKRWEVGGESASKAAPDYVGEDQRCVGSNDLDRMTRRYIAITMSCGMRGGSERERRLFGMACSGLVEYL
jgi:hypothetical protein